MPLKALFLVFDKIYVNSLILFQSRLQMKCLSSECYNNAYFIMCKSPKFSILSCIKTFKSKLNEFMWSFHIVQYVSCTQFACK